MTNVSKLQLIGLALLLGVANALLLIVFEAIVNDGTNYIWNDLFQSDTHRWVVLPLAIVLSLVLSWSVRFFGQKRLAPLHTNFLEGMPNNTSLQAIGIILLIGAMSLLAGASLGPEASLVSASSALGILLAQRTPQNSLKSLLALASVGALLVAFLGSLVLALVPCLLLYKQQKKVSLLALATIACASLASYLTLQLINSGTSAYAGIPLSEHFSALDYLLALVVGVAAAMLAHRLTRNIASFTKLAQRIESRTTWLVSAVCFGLILGILYLIGGQTIEFSGSAGSSMLLTHVSNYSLLALVGLVILKLIVTAWSLAAGYRGGLVFPSIYVGMAVGLVFSIAFESHVSPGIVIGAIAGMLSAVTGSPILAGILIVGILPLKLIGVAVAGIVGAYLGQRVLTRQTL